MPKYEIEHVAITVTDLDRAVAWYTTHFGFTEVKRSDRPDLQVRLALLQLGNRFLEIFEGYEPQPLPEGENHLQSSLQRVGTKHMALLVDDAAAAYQQLKDAGVEMDTELARGRTSQQFFCRDPDSILIEIIQRGLA
jgi:catechol 2,3-dioxygenase-like lactoylglutathione lyase family enzyme